MTAPIRTPIRKRSRHVALFLAGAAVLTLAACEEEKTDAAAFPDLESCIAEAKNGSLFFTEQDCQTQFAQAQQEIQPVHVRGGITALPTRGASHGRNQADTFVVTQRVGGQAGALGYLGDGQVGFHGQPL